MVRKVVVLALASAGACATSRPVSTGEGRGPPAGAPLLQLPQGVRPLRYVLQMDLTMGPGRERFRGAVAIDVELSEPRSVIWLHGRDLRVTLALVEQGGRSTAATWEQVTDQGVARLDLERPIGPGRATLRLAWDAPWNRRGAGLFLAPAGGDDYAATQFEAIDARRAFPCFDEPRFKTPFEVELTSRGSDVAVSNAPVLGETALDDGRKRTRFAPTRPLPTYLVFLAAGPFDVVERTLPPSDLRPRPLPVRGLAPRGRGGELAFALEAGNGMLVALERWFGTAFPYPKLDHVAVGAFGGAMENAGAILYVDTALLQDPERPDESHARGIAETMAHEMAHQWFGDLVTPAWWTDVWLNESFATWLGGRIADQYRPAWGVDRAHVDLAQEAMAADARASARAIRQPLQRTEEMWDQFDVFAYGKGGGVLATFERWLGRETFRAGLRAYLAEHADGTASTDDLLAALTRASGRDVAGPFAGFVDQAGVPLVLAAVECGPGGGRVRLSQQRYRLRGSAAPDASWEVPVCVRFGGREGRGEKCALVPPAGTSLALGPACPEWLIPDSGGTGYYRWTLAPPDLARLKTTGLARLDAAERLSLARNVQAAEQAGALGYAEALDLLAALAGDRDDRVAGVAMDAISAARDRLLPAADRGLAEAEARRLFRPLLRGTGFEPAPGEDEAGRRLRVRAVEFLALVGRDPEVRREAAARGRAYAGSDGRLHPEAVSGDLAALALTVAVEEDGAPLYDALLGRLGALDDGQQRLHVLRALADAERPDLDTRAGALWRDPRLRPGERLVPVLLSRSPRSRARSYAQVKANLEAVVPLLGAGLEAFLPLAADRFCDPSARADAIAFLGSARARYPAMRRNVDSVVEGIEACIAEREAEAGAARDWFSSREAAAAGGR